VHATQAFLKPLERLAIFDADPVPRLAIETTGSLPFDVKPLALHPGSGSEAKNWPENHWVGLLQALINSTGHSLLLVGGEAEGERLQRLAAALPPLRTRVAQSLPLIDLAAVLTRCRGFIGHDSGISHLAAALGLPGVVLWGETTQEIWRPMSDSVSVLRHPGGLNQLGAGEVFEQIHRLWPN
jgi:heptosyltransferase-2